MRALYAELCATITELKANPNALLDEAGGKPVAILSHNKPRAYLVPVDAYEKMVASLDDYELLVEACARMNDESVPVDIRKLRQGTG